MITKAFAFGTDSTVCCFTWHMCVVSAILGVIRVHFSSIQIELAIRQSAVA